MTKPTNGEAKLIVQDSTPYRRRVGAHDEASALAGIRAGSEDLEKGRSQPLREAFDKLRRKHQNPDAPGL